MSEISDNSKRFGKYPKSTQKYRKGSKIFDPSRKINNNNNNARIHHPQAKSHARRQRASKGIRRPRKNNEESQELFKCRKLSKNTSKDIEVSKFGSMVVENVERLPKKTLKDNKK